MFMVNCSGDSNTAVEHLSSLGQEQREIRIVIQVNVAGTISLHSNGHDAI